jgi:hypothetical protein
VRNSMDLVLTRILYSELAREKMWSRIHLIPVLQAEEDRDLVRRYLADKARERELLGAETKVYNNDRYVLRLNAATENGLLTRLPVSYGPRMLLHRVIPQSERRDASNEETLLYILWRLRRYLMSHIGLVDSCSSQMLTGYDLICTSRLCVQRLFVLDFKQHSRLRSMSTLQKFRQHATDQCQ